MKKLLMFLFLLLMSLVSVNAIAGDEIWNATFDSGNADYAKGVAIDSSDNVYVTGYSNDGTTYNYVTKVYDSSGTLINTLTFDSGNQDYANGVAIDSSDNVYVTGYSNDGTTNNYVTKVYNSSGTLINTLTFDSGNQDYAYSIAIDSLDNVYVTGRSHDGTTNNYVTKVYNSTGTLINTLTFDSGNTDIANGVAIDSSDNVYVTGQSHNGANYDYVTKVYNSAGTLINTLTFDSGNNDIANGVAIDSSDNVYVTGESSNGANNDYVTKVYNSAGTLINTLTFDSGNPDTALGIAIDSSDNVYVTGYSNDGTTYNYVTKVYDSSGTLINTLTFDNGGTDVAYGVAIDSSDNIYVTGYSPNGANNDYYTIKYEGYFAGVIITINNPTENEYLNNLNFTLNVSTDLNTNLTYSLNGVSNITLGNNINSSVTTITGIEGTNNITVYSNLSGDITDSGLRTWVIDTTNPNLTVNFPTEFNNYNGFNFSQYINFSDTNIDTCVVTISSESSTNCNQTDYNFTTNGNKTINVTVTDLAGNTNTSINNIMLINPIQYFYFTQLNGSQITNFSFGGTAFTNTASIKTYNDLISLGTNNLTFSKLGFATTDIIFNVNTTSNINLTTNITDSTIILQIFDGDTMNLLTGLTTITVVATVGDNTTTTTGLVNISNINFVTGEYQIIAEHTGYGTETVFFNYDNQQILQKDIYMLNTSLSNVGIITIEVTADSGEFLENAICKALEWMPTLSSFVSVAEGKTNVNGQTNLNIHIGTEIYKFECSKSGITTTSSSQIIQTTGSILPIVLTGISTTPINTFGKLVTSLTNTTIDNTTQLLTYTFNDGNNLITEACINIYEKKGTKSTLLSQNCTSSSSGTIFKTVNINNTFDTYAIATVNDGVTLSTVQQLVFKGIQALNFALNKYHLDILLPIVFSIIGISIGLILIPQNIFISVIGSVIMVWVSVLIVPTIISSSIAIFITFICLLMLYGGQKK